MRRATALSIVFAAAMIGLALITQMVVSGCATSSVSRPSSAPPASDEPTSEPTALESATSAPGSVSDTEPARRRILWPGTPEENARIARQEADSARWATRTNLCRCDGRPWQRPLEWLRIHQLDDGRWSTSNFESRCRDWKCGGAVEGRSDLETTALALLSFLGAGETHNAGTAKDNVRYALKHLANRQDEDGWFPFDPGDIRGHALATLAMSEAYGMTGSRLFKGPARRGLEALVERHIPNGGWRADTRHADVDVETSAWATFVLRSAQMAEIGVPEGAQTAALASLREFGPPAEHSVRERAMLCAARLVGGERFDDYPDLRPAVAAMVDDGLTWVDGDFDPRATYFASVAAFQAGHELWRAWKPELFEAIEEHRTGCEAVSPGGPHNTCTPWASTSSVSRAEGAVNSISLLYMSWMVTQRYERVFRNPDER